jgi:hypothetical protein
MMEFARSLSELQKNGFKPKRTITFCSWDGEEFNLYGSTYFGEKFADILKEKAVVYLNMDTAVSGTNLNVGLTPSLSSFFTEVTKKLTTPKNTSLYDSWDKNVDVLGAGSDYTVFLDHLGIASADFSFGGSYGVYHSVYDSFHWMETEGDPGFQYHRLMTQLIGLLALRFSELPFLPFNYTEYASFLSSATDSISCTAKSLNVELNIHPLYDSIADLSKSDMLISSLNLSSLTTEQRLTLNKGLYQAERGFLQPEGVPERKWFKHVVQSPGLDQGYGADVFASIVDALKADERELAQRQVHVIASLVSNVASSIRSLIPK